MIPRERLLARLRGADSVVLAAPSGFGKTTLIDQLVAGSPAIRVALHAADASAGRLLTRTTEGALEVGIRLPQRGDADAATQCGAAGDVLRNSVAAGAWLVIDDVQNLDADGVAALEGLIAGFLGGHPNRETTPAHRVAVAGRVVPWRPSDAVALGEDDLAFDLEETVAAVGDGATARDLALRCRRATQGWPAAVDLWARRPDAATLDPGTAVFDALLAGSLAGLSAAQLGLVAALPLLSPEVGVAAGWPTVVDDLTAAGIPLRRTGTWWSVGDVVRERLVRVGTVEPTTVEACAAVYARRGQLTHCIDVLFRADRAQALPAALAGLAPAAFESADMDEVAAVMTGLPDTAWTAAPAGALALAMAAESRARLGIRGRVLERLDQLSLTPEPALAHAVERLRDRAMEGAIEETLAEGQALLASIPNDQPGVRARCLYALGWAASLRDDTASLLQATTWFAESAGAARAARSDDDRARALSALAYRVHLKRAEFERAVNRFEEALALMGPASHHRAATLTFLAETLTQMGRDDVAMEALAEARAIARRMADTRMVAYCAWAAAKVAGRQRSTSDLHHWLAEANANRGDWYAHLTGTEFCAVASELCSQCGDETAAREWLAQTYAHPRLHEYPDIAWAAECSIETRFGDPAEGERLLHRLLEEGYTSYSERWRFRLWIGWCRHRRGDHAGAAEMVEVVRRETAAFGHPDLPMLHEPAMWTAMQESMPAGDDAATPEALLRVHVFAGFAVRHGEREIDVPGGKPQQLVKILAVSGRPVPVEEMADLLWPDVEPEVGRRRLRNVVARVRAAGDLLERNDDLLALAAAVAVDLLDFESAAQSALRSERTDRARRALAALDLCPGEVLPGDRFEDWSVAPRERARALATRLAESVLADAAGRGEPDHAVAAAERLLTADPYADHVADQVAAVLRAAGHTAAAAVWADRADRIRRDLGL